MRRIEATLGVWLFALASASAQTAEEPLPDLGSKTSDGFVVKCYWIGKFKQTEKFGGQAPRGVFGQSLSPLNGRQETTATIFITEEVDGRGELRAVVRGGNWESKVSKLHYWSKDDQRVFAGNGGAGNGRFPTSGPEAPTAFISRGAGTVSFNIGISTRDERMRFDVETYPLEIKGLSVKVSAQKEVKRWPASMRGLVATDEPVTGGRHTVIRQEWGEQRSQVYGSWTITRACEGATVKLITPRGDPRRAPRASGDGQNEFTFNSDSPEGKLVINFKAKVTPDTAVNAVREHVTFTIDQIAGSTMEWAENNKGGKARSDSRYLVAECTFTGLPPRNGDFGKKRVQLLFDGQMIEETKIEVFFKRNETNHPGGQANSPNWFHYWSQLTPGHKIKYGGAGHGPGGRVRGMAEWSYAEARDKKEITVFDPAKGKYRSYGVGEEFSGIDRFVGTIKHEARHVDQGVRADQLVPTNGSDSFRFGWSWKTPHNHWNKGADGKWGAANTDDDGDGNIDNARTAPPFEPGTGDDQTLGHPRWWFWPNAWALPVPNHAPGPIESDAINFSDRNHREHQNARDDWSDPGKNHQTLDRYDN